MWITLCHSWPCTLVFRSKSCHRSAGSLSRSPLWIKSLIAVRAATLNTSRFITIHSWFSYTLKDAVSVVQQIFTNIKKKNFLNKNKLINNSIIDSNLPMNKQYKGCYLDFFYFRVLFSVLYSYSIYNITRTNLPVVPNK